MCAEQELIISKLVVASLVIALEPNLANRCLLQLVKGFELPVGALARRLEKLRTLRSLPFDIAWLADVGLTLVTLFAGYHDLITKNTLQARD